MRAGDFESSVKYHSDLNPVAWDDKKMRPEVRERLLQIAGLFIQALRIPNFEARDIVLTGSMCNYNYTKYSDFDLHIIADYRAIDASYDIAEQLYNAKKEVWNDRHDITIGGFDVEMYIEDINEPPHSQGIFSVEQNKWIKTPVYDPPEIDQGAVFAKARMLTQEIDRTIADADSSEDFARLKDKIKKMRQGGLEKGGEFSVDNLAFKVLRNTGAMGRLYDAENRFTDRKLSL